MFLIRLSSSLFFFILLMAGKIDIASSVFIIVFFIILKFSIPININTILMDNVFFASFVLFYLLFGFLSSFINGASPAVLYATALKIFIALNIIRFSVRWIGSAGILSLIGLIPSEKLKLYLILTSKGIYLFRRNSRMIIMQIKSRLEPCRKNRRILARHYIHNMIFRELYTIQYLQASLYTRLPEKIKVYPYHGKPGLQEGLVACLVLIFIIKSLYFR